MSDPQPRSTSTLIAFRPGEMLPLLQARSYRGYDSLSLVAQAELEAHFVIMAEDLRSVTLLEGEAGLLCEVMNGQFMEPAMANYLWAGVEDALKMDGPALEEKWNVHGPMLLNDLKAWTAGQSWAVMDAVRRFWKNSEEAQRQGKTLAEQFLAVGLIKQARPTRTGEEVEPS